MVVPDFSGHLKTRHCKFVAKDFIFIFDKKETVRLSQRMGSISLTNAFPLHCLAICFKAKFSFSHSKIASKSALFSK